MKQNNSFCILFHSYITELLFLTSSRRRPTPLTPPPPNYISLGTSLIIAIFKLYTTTHYFYSPITTIADHTPTIRSTNTYALSCSVMSLYTCLHGMLQQYYMRVRFSIDISSHILQSIYINLHAASFIIWVILLRTLQSVAQDHCLLYNVCASRANYAFSNTVESTLSRKCLHISTIPLKQLPVRDCSLTMLGPRFLATKLQLLFQSLVDRQYIQDEQKTTFIQRLL